MSAIPGHSWWNCSSAHFEWTCCAEGNSPFSCVIRCPHIIYLTFKLFSIMMYMFVAGSSRDTARAEALFEREGYELISQISVWLFYLMVWACPWCDAVCLTILRVKLRLLKDLWLGFKFLISIRPDVKWKRLTSNRQNFSLLMCNIWSLCSHPGIKIPHKVPGDQLVNIRVEMPTPM